MDTQASYLFASNFERDTNAGAAGSLIAIGEQLAAEGNRVDFLWSPQQRYRLSHPRLGELFELPEIFRGQIAEAFERNCYDYLIASQPHAYRAFEWLRKRHPGTVLVNRTHGWEQRLAHQNRNLRWRRDPPGKCLLSRASQLLTDVACTRVVRSSDGIITSSNLCADYIRQRHGVPRGRVAMIPHGVSIAGDRTELQATNRMLFVGQYLARKGSAIVERLLPAVMDEFPSATMTFVVPPETVVSLQQIFQDYRGGRVTVLPWMAREQLFEIYKSHNILLYPSLFEGFGKVFLEAMASGLCVTGFAEGAIADIAKCGRDALFTAPGEIDKLRQLLVWALRNPARVRVIGRAAMETARQYSWGRSARATGEYCRMLQVAKRTGYSAETRMAPVGQFSAASAALLRSSGVGTIFRMAMLSSSSSKRCGADPMQAAAPMQSDRSIVTVKGIRYS